MDDKAATDPANLERQSGARLIIGVGASAGAMESIDRFFSKLSLEPDQALVLALQLDEALDEAPLREILAKARGGGFSDIHDGALVGGGQSSVSPAVLSTTSLCGHVPWGPDAQYRGRQA